MKANLLMKIGAGALAWALAFPATDYVNAKIQNKEPELKILPKDIDPCLPISTLLVLYGISEKRNYQNSRRKEND